MNKTITLAKINTTYLIKFLIVLSVATGAPLLGFHSQWITGPIVNMALILSVFMVGIRGALLIGILPSTIALSTGLLPAVLAPMIPFIILSNIILVLVVDYIRRLEIKNNYWSALVLGAGLKYLFLLLTSSIVIKLLLNVKVAPAVLNIMSWSQFFTAVIGGVLAFGVLKIIKLSKYST